MKNAFAIEWFWDASLRWFYFSNSSFASSAEHLTDTAQTIIKIHNGLRSILMSHPNTGWENVTTGRIGCGYFRFLKTILKKKLQYHTSKNCWNHNLKPLFFFWEAYYARPSSLEFPTFMKQSLFGTYNIWPFSFTDTLQAFASIFQTTLSLLIQFYASEDRNVFVSLRFLSVTRATSHPKPPSSPCFPWRPCTFVSEYWSASALSTHYLFPLFICFFSLLSSYRAKSTDLTNLFYFCLTRAFTVSYYYSSVPAASIDIADSKATFFSK